MGLTMSGIILSEYYIERNRKYNIEDGQTRLSILQQFHNGDFQYKGKYFNDLKERYRNLEFTKKKIITNACAVTITL